jgi:hypothetical protein
VSAVFDRAVDSIALANAERLVDTLRMKRQPRRDALPEGYSVRRLLDNLAHDKRHGYLEAEISADLERTHPTQHNGRIIPWEAFTRADIVGTSTAGGYLTESANIDAADALRPNMVVGALGATFIPAPYGANVNLRADQRDRSDLRAGRLHPAYGRKLYGNFASRDSAGRSIARGICRHS